MVIEWIDERHKLNGETEVCVSSQFTKCNKSNIGPNAVKSFNL